MASMRFAGPLSLAILFFGAAAPVAEVAAAPPPPAPDRADRLVGLARVWATVKFFHPILYQREVDWDGALVRAIPEVEAAADASAYQAALAHLLGVLNDPTTRVEPRRAWDATAAAAGSTWSSWPAPDVLLLELRALGDTADYVPMLDKLKAATPELAKAKVVILDLRGFRENPMFGPWLLIAEGLPAISAWPFVRSLQHYGWRPDDTLGEELYTTSWQVRAAESKPAPKAGPVHVIFVVDPEAPLPLVAEALWAEGRATLVSPAPLTETAAAPVADVALPYDLVAHVRTADVLLADHRSLTGEVVPAGVDPRARALDIAVAVTKGRPPPRSPARTSQVPDTLRIVADDDFAAQPLPTRERRILAAFRVWAVIEFFYPYRKVLGDWERTLREALPALDAAADAGAYRRVLQRMGVTLHDGHVRVSSRADPPRAPTAVIWRRVEGKVVAAGFRDAAAAAAAGVALGDELVAIDGQAVGALLADRLPVVTGGTEEARQQRAVTLLDFGLPDTELIAQIRPALGPLRAVTLVRRPSFDANAWGRAGPHFRLLPGGIGYADLGSLMPGEVDAMFEAFAGTRGIVFDLRGYPNGTVIKIAPRIDTRKLGVATLFNVPLVGAYVSMDGVKGFTRLVHEVQPLYATDRPPYRGRIAVLIDDRAVSQAEHSCLFFEAAAPVKFVGSPTHGTNGDVTNVRLPGGLSLRFTGLEVLHADGRQLQQVGVHPDIEIRPTIAGLRAGRDEVLERALKWVQTGR